MVSDDGPREAARTERADPRAGRRMPHHERVIFRLALASGFPAVAVAMIVLWRGGYSGKVQWTLGLVVIGSWLITALVLRERVVRPLQTLSNMLAALREGDYSIRARGADPKISSITIGAKPRDGSSSRITFGFDIKARPITSICCSPPE